MNLPQILAATAVLILSTTSSFAAEVDNTQLLKDCKHEAVSDGLSGADVDSYVIECVEDFEETDIINTKLLPKQ